MDLSITSYTANYVSQTTSTKSTKSTDAQTAKKTTDEAAVYEKSSNDTKKTSYDYSATIQQLKADQANRAKQLVDLVNSTINGQGKAFSIAGGKVNSLFDDALNGHLAEIFKNIKADDATVAQAQKDIAEDGYWGVSQTSDRLVSMAQALAGGDPSKADKLISAIKKGFDQAKGAWGENLPDICKKTIDSAIEKMEQWRDSVQ